MVLNECQNIDYLMNPNTQNRYGNAYDPHNNTYMNIDNNLTYLQQQFPQDIPNKELTRTSEDNCYLWRRTDDNKKQLKYFTYHFNPFGCTVQAPYYLVNAYKDGFGISGCNVDQDSLLKIADGNKLTNRNFPQELQALPINIPRIPGGYDVDVTSELRYRPTYNYKPCSRTTEKSFIPNTFQYFRHLCYDPQQTQFIIQEDTFQDAFGDPRYHRAGEETRHRYKELLRGGNCDGKFEKYYRFLPRKHHSNFGNLI